MKNWSLNKKIWAVLGLLIVAFVGSTYFSLTRLSNVKDSLNEITQVQVPRDKITSEINDNQRLIVIAVLNSIVIKDPAALKQNEERFNRLLKDQEEDLARYEETATAEGRAILKKYRAAYNRFLDLANQSREYSLQNKTEEAVAIYLDAEKAIESLREHINDLNDMTAQRLKQVSEESNAAASQAILMGLVISLTSILLSVTIAFFVLRAVTRAINDVVKSLFDSSLQVSSAASQIASSSEELSQSATEQAASLEETAASIEEMNSMVSKNSENANSAASTSSKSQEKATQGKVVVEKMIDSMDAINRSNNTIMDQVNQSNESMAGIVKVIEEIGAKTKVINDIVFQTKLLSFNASVEAARAGEHGKGFAVVAEEVGNLAQMSGNAAKEIGSMLDESIQKVNHIVNDTKSSVERLIAEGRETVESGSQVARQCGEVLEEIVHNVESVSSMADEIASASQEQSRGVGEITKAMGQLDQMTQQNASVSEECASSAEELSAQAESLKNAVGQLVATINGASARPQESEESFSAEPKAQASASKPAQNVVHLKNPSKEKAAPPKNAPALKKASGDVPSYDSEGFEEV